MQKEKGKILNGKRLVMRRIPYKSGKRRAGLIHTKEIVKDVKCQVSRIKLSDSKYL